MALKDNVEQKETGMQVSPNKEKAGYGSAIDVTEQ